jgi:hypothetical protein
MNYFLPNWIIVGPLLLLAALLSVGCKIFFSKQETPKLRKVAERVELGPNWLEIIPQPPLAATAKIQYIGLKAENIKGWADETKQKLVLADGKQINIEVELIDEKDNSTFLFPNGLGEFVEFGKRAQNRENTEEAYFEIGTKFKKIRLRSNVPISAGEIIWAEFEF